ncbi:group II intron maturase-specific domain-containing protein [Streptosporangium roseum]|uniref:group II intron maturase-specific domain-containing protein n=1 Tax=Streptosporangium roseum TaxID=2001 RepID=UPI00332D23AF
MPANLILHYALDAWLVREFPTVEFERYADDAVLYCVTERQARHVLAALHERMGQVGLILHPAKTQIVYCKDANRRLKYGTIQFMFLGFTFRPRTATAKDGTLFMSFLPAIGKDALNKISNDVRSWRLHRRIGSTFVQLAKAINPIVQGWMRYCGAFYRTALYPFLERINSYLMRWIRKKYRRLRTIKKALRAFQNAVRSCPAMFRHWQWVPHAWRTG